MTATIHNLDDYRRPSAKVIPIRDMTTGETLLLPHPVTKGYDPFERERRSLLALIFGPACGDDRPSDTEPAA